MYRTFITLSKSKNDRFIYTLRWMVTINIINVACHKFWTFNIFLCANEWEKKLIKKKNWKKKKQICPLYVYVHMQTLSIKIFYIFLFQRFFFSNFRKQDVKNKNFYHWPTHGIKIRFVAIKKKFDFVTKKKKKNIERANRKKDEVWREKNGKNLKFQFNHF